LHVHCKHAYVSDDLKPSLSDRCQCGGQPLKHLKTADTP
jgi:hypothetical protein